MLPPDLPAAERQAVYRRLVASLQAIPGVEAAGGVNPLACARAVLKAAPGVSDAVVKLDAKSATVTFDPAQTSVGALKAAIEDVLDRGQFILGPEVAVLEIGDELIARQRKNPRLGHTADLVTSAADALQQREVRPERKWDEHDDGEERLYGVPHPLDAPAATAPSTAERPVPRTIKVRPR